MEVLNIRTYRRDLSSRNIQVFSFVVSHVALLSWIETINLKTQIFRFWYRANLFPKLYDSQNSERGGAITILLLKGAEEKLTVFIFSFLVFSNTRNIDIQGHQRLHCRYICDFSFSRAYFDKSNSTLPPGAKEVITSDQAETNLKSVLNYWQQLLMFGA